MLDTTAQFGVAATAAAAAALNVHGASARQTDRQTDRPSSVNNAFAQVSSPQYSSGPLESINILYIRILILLQQNNTMQQREVVRKAVKSAIKYFDGKIYNDN